VAERAMHALRCFICGLRDIRRKRACCTLQYIASCFTSFRKQASPRDRSAVSVSLQAWSTLVGMATSVTGQATRWWRWWRGGGGGGGVGGGW